jgi:hypothetical protein
VRADFGRRHRIDYAGLGLRTNDIKHGPRFDGFVEQLFDPLSQFRDLTLQFLDGGPRHGLYRSSVA